LRLGVKTPRGEIGFELPPQLYLLVVLTCPRV
jgi:hypothetical protein